MTVRGATLGLALLLVLPMACTAPTPPRREANQSSSTACVPPQGRPKAETATTIEVIEQAYFCILDRYYSGAELDHRPLLTAGFVALTRELERHGHDLAHATMPPLSGDRKGDWAAFEKAYRKITARVPKLRDRLAVVTLEAIVAALGDNHAKWTHGVVRPPDHYDGDGYGLGLEANVYRQQVNADTAIAPLFVTAVPGGAAAKAGLRPGDIIESINGSAPFIDGRATAAIAALYPQYPEARPVRLRLLRQSDGRRWTVTLQPGVFQQDLDALQLVRSKLLKTDQGNVAYVRIRGFAPDSAKRALAAISRLRTGRTLTGIVFDLRGNAGGSPPEATRLVSAFAHGEVTGHLCKFDGTCETTRTDDTVDLIDLPIAVLTDRGCASACEHFSSTVKDLRLGPLVGTRTAGEISGPARPYRLDNNTTLSFPERHGLGPDREVIDGIGVAPDHHVPLTPKDVAAGRDLALAKALTLLQN